MKANEKLCSLLTIIHYALTLATAHFQESHMVLINIPSALFLSSSLPLSFSHSLLSPEEAKKENWQRWLWTMHSMGCVKTILRRAQKAHIGSLRHTHTHTCIWWISMFYGDVMVFILYKLYFFYPLPKSYPKPTTHTKCSAFLDFQKDPSVWVISLFFSWGPKNVPTRSKFTSVLVGTFGPHNVGNTMYTQKHTCAYRTKWWIHGSLIKWEHIFHVC